MNTQEYFQASNLERYAFFWSLARMAIAAVSLFFGAMPIAYTILGRSSVSSLLPLFWLVSGVASIYLIYRWYKSGQMVFGGKDPKNTVAFFVMVVTGLNLGYAAISYNIGMNIVWGMPMVDLIFKATAVVYLLVAFYLWKQWSAAAQTLFNQNFTEVVSQNETSLDTSSE